MRFGGRDRAAKYLMERVLIAGARLRAGNTVCDILWGGYTDRSEHPIRRIEFYYEFLDAQRYLTDLRLRHGAAYAAFWAARTGHKETTNREYMGQMNGTGTLTKLAITLLALAALVTAAVFSAKVADDRASRTHVEVSK